MSHVCTLQCSVISDADSDLLVLMAEKVEKKNHFHKPKIDKDTSELLSVKFKIIIIMILFYFNDFLKS